MAAFFRLRIVRDLGIALIVVFGVGSIAMLLAHVSPFDGFYALFDGAFGTTSEFAETLVSATALLFPWSDTYSVKIGIIDMQHKNLVNILNDLHHAMVSGQGKQSLGKILSDLILKGSTDLIDAELLSLRRFAEGRMIEETAVL